LVAIGDVNELHRDAHAIRQTSDAALENRFNIQLAADFANVLRAIPKPERGRSGSNLQALKSGKRTDQILGETIAEVVGGAVATDNRDLGQIIGRG
jgi:hypothetical protein